MIYDCFTFFNELDLLEIRLNILKDVVDKFIIIEGSKTHSGMDKPYNFDINIFKQFEDKIIYRQFDTFPPFKNAWIYENLQRNYILEVLNDFAHEEDIILLSDVDEIPNSKAILHYKKHCDGIMSLRQKMYYYFLNMQNVTEPDWDMAKIFRYKEFFNRNNNCNFVYSEYLPEEINLDVTPNKIRLMQELPILRNGGWHFSYLGGVDKIIEKIKSFSHQEFNSEQYTSSETLIKLINAGKDIFGRDFKYKAVNIDDSFPKYLRSNREKYSHLIFKITLENIKQQKVKELKRLLKKFLITSFLLKMILKINTKLLQFLV